MEYDVQKALDFILNEKNSAPKRAIKLFTMMVVLHGGTSLAKVTGRASSDDQISLKLSISRRKLRHARLLAAMKFLDQIEIEWRQSNPGKRPRLKAMAQIAEYREIYDDIILKYGGWQKIRFVSGLREFESEVEAWKRQARDIARIIEFSVRFQKNEKKRKQTGGITMATDIVTRGSAKKLLNTKLKDTAMEEHWSRLKSSAPFHYLLYRQKYAFFLKALAGKRFAQKWLARVGDRKTLLEFFVSYNELADRLRPRGYRYSKLRLPGDAPTSTMVITPFNSRKPMEAAVLRQIANYAA